MYPQEDQYSIVQIKKHKTIAATLVYHIMRKKEKMVDGKVIEDDFYPANANPEKGVGNRILIDPLMLACKSNGKSNMDNPDNSVPPGTIDTISTSGVTRLSIMRAINNRIRECGIKTRKGQNLALEIVITGSHETMESMTDVVREQWIRETLEWVKRHFGEKNIIAAALHMDETTPHIHFIVVPIYYGESRRTKSYLRRQKEHTGKEPQKSYRLSADAFFTTRKKKDYHSSYSEEVGEHFGLRRPIEADPGSRVRHKESIEHNRQLTIAQ